MVIVRRWNQLYVGRNIIYKGLERQFSYRIEGRSQDGDMLMLSFHRPPRVRRETTFLFGIQYAIDKGRILAEKK